MSVSHRLGSRSVVQLPAPLSRWRSGARTGGREERKRYGAAKDDGLTAGTSMEEGSPLLPSFPPDVGLDVADPLPPRNVLWKAAVKLPMYWVGVLPVAVGTASAYYETGNFLLGHTLALLFGSICVIAWLNLSNDVFDHETGADVEKPESFVNLTRNAALIFGLSLVFLSLGVGALGSVFLGRLGPSLMLAGAVACGYLYQGPPFRLSYNGLGEPLCFVAFGPLATSSFYLQSSGLRSLSSTSWAASCLVGLSTAVVLFCSHFHQYDSDKAANKRSPVVRLGGAAVATKVLSATMFVFFCMVIAMISAELLPKVLMPLSTVPAILAWRCVKYAEMHSSNLSKLRFLKLYALDLHASFGIALCIALLTARRLMVLGA